MRAAIYFTPPAGAGLTRTAASWLGRDAFSGEATRAPDTELDPLVAEPARYGFHATLRAPFRLAEGYDLSDVDERLASFCAARRPFRLKTVGIARLGSFFALTPNENSAALSALEADVLEDFDPFRAPLSEAEIARRKPETLSERRQRHLLRWGYPHVLDDFRFHMTLTGAVEAAKSGAVAERLAAVFAGFDGAPLEISGLALFVEPHSGAPFRVHSLHLFGA